MPGEYFEWTTGSPYSINSSVMVALSFESPDDGWESLQYSWYTSSNQCRIYESGGSAEFIQYGYAIGEVLKIERTTNGEIVYSVSGNPVRTVNDPNPNQPMIVDFAFGVSGAQIFDLQIYTERDYANYTADVTTYSDYYPFGMQMPGRSGNSSEYRYGFNGSEKDDEIKGEGNHYDLGLRNYDPRIGRMFSIDPRANEYPWQTTYAYHRNSPIMTIDYLGGGDGIYIDEETGEVLGEDEHGADDGLIHYTSKENWDNNRMYANKSERLKQGGISKTINIHEQQEEQQEAGDNTDVFYGITEENPELNNELVEDFTRSVGAVEKTSTASGGNHPGMKGVGSALTVIEAVQILKKASDGDIEGAVQDAAVLTFETVVVDRALASPNPYTKAAAIAYYTIKLIATMPETRGVSPSGDWFENEQDKDNTRVGTGQGF